MHKFTVLLIEDEKSISDFTSRTLTSHNYRVVCASTGTEALSLASSLCPDIFLLDLGLPDMDGMEIIRSLRTWSGSPIIVVSARTLEDDKVRALDAGADDYLTKPFGTSELLARIRCVTRRSLMLSGQADGRLTYHDVSWAVRDMCLSGPSGTCTLSKHEGDLLEAFLHTPGQTLARDTLLLKVWGPDSDVETGNLDNYIHFLRRRLKSVDSTLQIKTVRGVGYGLFIS